MDHRHRIPTALTIAGSDSGGGAGIQADLKTFASLGVHGTTAITCLTAQNPRGVRGIQPATPRHVRQQIEAVFDQIAPSAMKTGMLYSRAIIEAVVGCLKNCPRIPLVVDPVMIATSGSMLLRADAVQALQTRLLPSALLLTPNVDEAALLAELRIRSVEDLRSAARRLHGRYGCGVLVKGGHLRGLREAIDILFDGRQEWLLSAPFVRGVSTHGSGCTYSAAVTAWLARGRSLPEAVRAAKDYITQAIASSVRVGSEWVLNWRTKPAIARTDHRSR